MVGLRHIVYYCKYARSNFAMRDESVLQVLYVTSRGRTYRE